MHRPDTLSPPNGPGCCLHLVAGAGRDALDDCLAQVAPGDWVVFLDEGVLQLLHSPMVVQGAVGSVFFSDADLRAHGLVDSARKLQSDIIDDAGICALLAQCEHCLTWR